MKLYLEPDSDDEEFDDREVSYKPPEGNYQVAFCQCREIKGKKIDNMKIRITWDILYPVDHRFQYKVWKDYPLEGVIAKQLKSDLRRIFGDDLSEFVDSSGAIDTDKLLGEKADATVVYKFTNEYEDPLVVVKTLYPAGKFKLQ
jgi:hypothetical protein